METINKRTLNDGYKIVGTISQIKAEQDSYLPVRSASYRETIYDYQQPAQPMKFKYVATILTKLGTVELPVSKEFADEMGERGVLGSTLEITIVRK